MIMNVHFIAIGGSVMHQLAISLKRKGYQVTGSDDEIFEPASGNLRKEGILPEQSGWFPEKIIPGLDAVILGMHAKEDNPELTRANEAGLKIYSFPEYIYEESRTKRRVVIGGSHGKTTTTAMIMHVLKKTGKAFDYLVGAELEGFDLSVNITDAPVIVCEGDEYPASVIRRQPKFHFLFPHVAVITGIAWDHINVFPTFEIYLEQFHEFIDKIVPGGVLIYNQDDPVLAEIVQKHSSRVTKVGYGVPEHTIAEGRTSVVLDGQTGALKVFGDHNLLNLHAAWLACKELGIGAEVFLAAISSFTGASKRLELLASDKTLNVYRDFAHAPSKVKATIAAVKQQFPGRKLIAVLELHTYSSLNANFMGEYKGAMKDADMPVVFYSKHALELKRLPVLPEEDVYRGFDKEGLQVINDRETLERWLMSQDYDSANLLLMSSGNYDGLDMTIFATRLVQKNN